MSMKAIVAVFAMLTATPAWAEVMPFKATAAPAKSVQTDTYYETSGIGICDSTFCAVYFPKIKKSSAVLFKRVSCIAQHVAPIYLAAFGVADKKGGTTIDPNVTLAITPSIAGEGQRVSQFNQEVLLRVPGGAIPSAAVLTSAAGSVVLTCTATGSPD